MVFKDRLSVFFMLHPLPQQHTYDALKVFMLASDRNIAAITPSAAGITTLPAAAAVETASPPTEIQTAFTVIQKQIKDLTATVSKLHVRPDHSFVPPEGKCRTCWGPNKFALVNRDWLFCAEHNRFCVFAPEKK